MSAGFTGKYIKRTVLNMSANSFAIDGGIIYNTELFGSAANLGFSVRNVGLPIKFIDTGDALDSSINIGIQVEPVKILRVIGDFGYGFNYNEFEGGIGLEFSFAKILFPRCGINISKNITVFAGLGITLFERFGFDYALTINSYENRHYFQLTFSSI